jgi:hypothetical protein
VLVGRVVILVDLTIACLVVAIGLASVVVVLIKAYLVMVILITAYLGGLVVVVLTTPYRLMLVRLSIR